MTIEYVSDDWAMTDFLDAQEAIRHFQTLLLEAKNRVANSNSQLAQKLSSIHDLLTICHFLLRNKELDTQSTCQIARTLSLAFGSYKLGAVRVYCVDLKELTIQGELIVNQTKSVIPWKEILDLKVLEDSSQVETTIIALFHRFTYKKRINFPNNLLTYRNITQVRLLVTVCLNIIQMTNLDAATKDQIMTNLKAALNPIGITVS